MGHVTVPTINAGVAKRAEVIAAIAAVANEFNGGIDNDNIDAAAAIDPSKIAGLLTTAFSEWLTWTPTFTGFSVDPVNVVATYQRIGKTVIVNISAFGGTSNATGLTFTLPVTAATRTNNVIDAWCRAQDNGAVATTPGLVEFTSGATAATVYKDHSGANAWTNSGTKGFRATFSYESA